MELPKHPSESRGLSPRGLAGAVLLGIGVVLLVGSGAYYAYGSVAKSNLEELSYSAERPSAVGTDEDGVLSRQDSGVDGSQTTPSQQAGVADSQSQTPSPATDELSRTDAEPARETAGLVETIGGAGSSPGPGAEATSDGSGEAAPLGPDDGDVPPTAQAGAVAGQQQVTVVGAADPPPEDSKAVVGSGPAQSLEAADAIESEGSADGKEATAIIEEESADQSTSSESPEKLTAIADDRTGPSIQESTLEGAFLFSPGLAAGEEAVVYYDPSRLDLTGDSLPATKISISGIQLRSDVQELAILFLGDSLQWETPNGVVGHIPTTAKPSGGGQGWYFGHLESPIRGEGNVFLRLPEIPNLLANEEAVYVVLEAANRKYLYQVYQTEVVYQDDLRVTDSGSHDITLVTCVPRFYYDHRLLVTAALIGVSES